MSQEGQQIMPDQNVIDALIATYRELNYKVRNSDVALSVVDGVTITDNTVAGILLQLRNRELNASQAVKQMILTSEEVAVEDDEGPLVMAEQTVAGNLTPSILLSQFGTAREATLSIVRELSDENWARTHKTPRGEMTLQEYLQTLVDRDRQRMQEIENLLAKSPA